MLFVQGTMWMQEGVIGQATSLDLVVMKVCIWAVIRWWSLYVITLLDDKACSLAIQQSVHAWEIQVLL